MDGKHLGFIAGLIILDQITKYFFEITRNTGAAFGILKGWNLFLVIFSLIALGFFIYYYNYKGYRRLPYQPSATLHKLACGLVIAGIIGNLIDRVYFGAVRDFIDVRIWPVFNLADSFMVVGVGLLVWMIIRKD